MASRPCLALGHWARVPVGSAVGRELAFRASRYHAAFVDADEALELAKGAARVRQLRFVGPHVTGRMSERQVARDDIMEAIKTATTAKPSDDGPGRWVIGGGVDLDGDDLSVVVRIDGSRVWVVTIF